MDEQQLFASIGRVVSELAVQRDVLIAQVRQLTTQVEQLRGELTSFQGDANAKSRGKTKE